jgi:hypothetical protein
MDIEVIEVKHPDMVKDFDSLSGLDKHLIGAFAECDG